MRLTKGLTAAAMAAIFGFVLPAVASAKETLLLNSFFPPQHYVCSKFLPELDKRIEAAGVAYWDTHQKYFADKDEYGDAVLIAMFALNGGDIFSVTDTPITSVADLASRKIWSVPGATSKLLADTGSSVVSGPAVQMLELVSKGVVDGHVGVPQSEVAQYKLTDYTKSATIFDEKIFQTTFSFFVSKAKWNKISDTDRAAIQAAAGRDFVRWMGAEQDAIFDAAHSELVAAGVEFVEGTPEFLSDLKVLGQPQIAAWLDQIKANGVDGQTVLDDYKANHVATIQK